MPEARDTRGLGAFIRDSGYLRKWLILGVAIGVIAGLGAVVFYLALDYAGRFLLGYLAGYHIPKPIGDGGDLGSTGFQRPWAIPLWSPSVARWCRLGWWRSSRPRPRDTARTAPSRPSTPTRAAFGSGRSW